MARAILTLTVIFLVGVLVGCSDIDTGKAQLVQTKTKAVTVVNVASTTETDIVEQMAVNRQAYRKGLSALVEYYIKTGNNMKLAWAKKEMDALDAIPHYNYIIEAGVAGPDLKASASIPEADELYAQAVEIESKAGPLLVIKDETLLRKALDKYNQLIKKYPSSDKIDDAVFRAALIYEHFKDYTIAILYYQRTYQWDPETPYPAKFKEAFILDQYLHRRAEALELYRQALKVLREYDHPQWKAWAEKRISEITASDKKSE
jgi:tetratricopeptide (TPR) repeat protein